MVKKSLRGKRTKKKYTKKENKRYKKRYTKRNTKNNNLKGGRLTPRQQELLRKVNRRTDYCRKKNKFQKRDFNDCSSKVVCKWGIKDGETSARCMKNNEAILKLNYSLVSDYYPPFTKIHYETMGDQTDQTTISELPNLMSEGIINDSTLVWIEGMEEWKLLSETNILESPVQAQAPPRPPRDYGSVTEPEPVTFDDTRPVVDSAVVDAWINERGEREYQEMTSETRGKCYSSNNPTDNCVYFNPQTNIDIVSEVLKREAKSGSNIYLHIDVAHGYLTGQETNLNSNLHLLLTPARGFEDWGADGTATTLSVMKKFLDDKGHEDLFNGDGCMTLKGSLLFYSISLLHSVNADLMQFIMENIHRENANKEIKLSEVLNALSHNLEPSEWNFRKILFRILKLYKPKDTVNDTKFWASQAERERMSGNMTIYRDRFMGPKDTKFGLTILYTNKWNENKYIHLPLNEDNIKRSEEEGTILLSEILKYLKPLEQLSFNFFMKHGSCRVDDEFHNIVYSREDTRPRIYNPDLSSLTRKISTPKENAHKNCFINYFEEPQRKEVRRVLSEYPTLIDYYVWLEAGSKQTSLINYINILMEHGEGSPELYKFIMENH